MKILLADSDRDFLQSYQKLLTMDGHEVTTAFDGAQAVSLLGTEAFGFAVLEEHLPRIENEQLLQFLEKNRIPSIVLTDSSVTVKRLLNPVLPHAYLAFPFLPDDLTGMIEAVAEKTHATESLFRCGVEVDVARFCFSGTPTRLTNDEIDLFDALQEPLKAAGKRTRILIQALNEKLRRIGSGTRVLYEIEKGYRLVNENA